MSVIKQMDAKLANMIAAGEVVERPASIIKELVENSIDAKATTIQISVIDNGIKEIKVVDNGIGMDEVDIKNAFLRHATSKIKTEYDLERINTLGFRGEALAAILSVSKVLVKTRQENNNGHFVEFKDSLLINSGSATLNEGTEITINDLFYNTPARLKYLKSEFSERSAIIDTFDRLALSNPNIRFSLTIDSKLIKETFGNGDYFSLLNQIYGSSVTKDLKIIEHEFSKIKLKAYLGSPSVSRSRKKDISIFVNGRYIKNYALTQAIIDGYHSFLMTNKYPLAVLILELDPSLLDVNVHPQKLEVKFMNETLIKYHIEMFIKEALLDIKHEIPQNISMFKEKFVDYSKIEQTPKQNNEVYIKEKLDFNYIDEKLNSNYKEEIINKIDSSSDYLKKEEEVKKLPELYYVGTLAGTYLLFQNDEGLYLIDQHAAQERINYEYYYEFVGQPQIIMKDMFIPRALNLTTNDIEIIKTYKNNFEEIGFRFNEVYEITSHPSFILDKDLEQSLNDMIKMLLENKKINLKTLLDQLAKDKSCKASIRANEKISRIEIDEIISNLRKTKNPYTCPHGRPTIIKISHYEIERMFKRVV